MMIKMLESIGAVHTHTHYNLIDNNVSIFMLYLWYIWEIDFSLPLIFVFLGGFLYEERKWNYIGDVGYNDCTKRCRVVVNK